MVTKKQTEQPGATPGRKQPDPDVGTAHKIHTLAHLLYGQLAGATPWATPFLGHMPWQGQPTQHPPEFPASHIHRAPEGCAQPKEVKMFWNDPSMYGATLYKEPGKELYPREFGFPTPFGLPTAYANPTVPPWMGYQKPNIPFVGQQTYGYPQQYYGNTPTYLPWVNPMLQNLHVNPYVRPFAYENQFNAFRPTIW